MVKAPNCVPKVGIRRNLIAAPQSNPTSNTRLTDNSPMASPTNSLR